jgi:DNA replication protein DnaC
VSFQLSPICSACGGTGWTRVSREGVEGVVRCDCVKSALFSKLTENARIPKRYEHCELDNFESVKGVTTQKTALAKIAAEKFVEEYPMSPPFGLLFMGPQGVGKTHLAVGIIKRLMREKNVQCLFWTFPELLKEIQNSYNPISQTSELSLLSPVLEAEVLVLDELGAQNPSSWVRDTVSYVLNYRYNENKVTILTTNYLDRDEGPAKPGVPDTLTERIGDRMRSRLYEMCKTVEMGGKDFRKEVKEAQHHFKRREN